MLKKIILMAVVLLTAGTKLNAQEYKFFTFSEKADFNMTDQQKESEEAVLKRTYSTQYVIEENDEGQYIFSYTARWINSDKAIKGNNKVYLAGGENTEYLYQKARVIKPNGEIVELRKSDIKEGVYEENDQKYYYFALEGLEKGSIVETANYRKQKPGYYGSLIYLQEDVDRFNQEYELICPSFLKFAFKSINGAPEVVFDTTTEEFNRWSIKLDSVKAVKQQPTMFTDVVKQGVLSKIDRNVAKNLGDLTSYGTASRSIFSNLNPEYSKSEKKKISKIAKELKFSDFKDDKSKIKAIENYLKSSIQVIESTYSSLAEIDFIFENKAANSTGMARLHVALLNLAEVGFEIVITTDRTDLRFDPEFEAYLFLDNYLLYFPNEEMFLAPSEKYLRAPLVPSEWVHNYGLFIKQVGVGDVKIPIGKVKFIDALPYDMTKDEMIVDVNFAADILHPNVKMEKSGSGYSAEIFQPYFHLMDEEAVSNAKKSMVEMINEEMTAEEVEIENVEVNDIGSKPFVYRFETKEHSFVEKAGNDYLFKLGLLIGPQMEMYQEDDREYDVESRNSRYYGRVITFNIPEGYEIKNLDDLKMDLRFGEEGNENLYFTSEYKIEGSKVTVTNKEYYTQIIYPKADFKDYQKIINAAADFNKIVLVIQKK